MDNLEILKNKIKKLVGKLNENGFDDTEDDVIGSIIDDLDSQINEL